MNFSELGYKSLIRVCRSIPEDQAEKLIPLLSKLYMKVDTKFGQNLKKNLEVLGDFMDEDLSPLIPKVYEHFSSFLYEFFSYNPAKNPFITNSSLRDTYEKNLGPANSHGPAIAVAGHFGNWELGLKAVLSFGYKISTVALPHSSPAVDEIFKSLRDHPNLEISFLKEGIQPCLDALRRNRIVVLACERDYTRRGPLVHVANREVHFPIGPAYLHQHTGAPLFFANMKRLKLGEFSCELEPIFLDSPNDTPLDLNTMSQMIADRLFKSIMQCPEQWVTFDDFFKKRKAKISQS